MLTTMSRAVPGMLLVLSIILISILLKRMIQREVSCDRNTLCTLATENHSFYATTWCTHSSWQVWAVYWVPLGSRDGETHARLPDGGFHHACGNLPIIILSSGGGNVIPLTVRAWYPTLLYRSC